jgi:Phosphopantetheine attachment site
MTVSDSVLAVFRKVAADQGQRLMPLTDDLRLTDSGLDSLAFAIVVSSLEEMLNVDPFGGADWVEFPVTLGDFIRLYDRSPA